MTVLKENVATTDDWPEEDQALKQKLDEMLSFCDQASSLITEDGEQVSSVNSFQQVLSSMIKSSENLFGILEGSDGDKQSNQGSGSALALSDQKSRNSKIHQKKAQASPSKDSRGSSKSSRKTKRTNNKICEVNDLYRKLIEKNKKSLARSSLYTTRHFLDLNQATQSSNYSTNQLKTLQRSPDPHHQNQQITMFKVADNSANHLNAGTQGHQPQLQPTPDHHRTPFNKPHQISLEGANTSQFFVSGSRNGGNSNRQRSNSIDQLASSDAIKGLVDHLKAQISEERQLYQAEIQKLRGELQASQDETKEYINTAVVGYIDQRVDSLSRHNLEQVSQEFESKFKKKLLNSEEFTEKMVHILDQKIRFVLKSLIDRKMDDLIQEKMMEEFDVLSQKFQRENIKKLENAEKEIESQSGRLEKLEQSGEARLGEMDENITVLMQQHVRLDQALKEIPGLFDNKMDLVLDKLLRKNCEEVASELINIEIEKLKLVLSRQFELQSDIKVGAVKKLFEGFSGQMVAKHNQLTHILRDLSLEMNEKYDELKKGSQVAKKGRGKKTKKKSIARVIEEVSLNQGYLDLAEVKAKLKVEVDKVENSFFDNFDGFEAGFNTCLECSETGLFLLTQFLHGWIACRSNGEILGSQKLKSKLFFNFSIFFNFFEFHVFYNFL